MIRHAGKMDRFVWRAVVMRIARMAVVMRPRVATMVLAIGTRLPATAHRTVEHVWVVVPVMTVSQAQVAMPAGLGEMLAFPALPGCVPTSSAAERSVLHMLVGHAVGVMSTTRTVAEISRTRRMNVAVVHARQARAAMFRTIRRPVFWMYLCGSTARARRPIQFNNVITATVPAEFADVHKFML